MARVHDHTAHRSLLRASGLRATASRIAVFGVMDRHRRPMSHAEVHRAVAGTGGFDRATVYRNLTDLTGVGLLRRTDLGDHVWRFERAHRGCSDRASHPHFVCSHCGDVRCLPEECIEVRATSAYAGSLLRGVVEVQLRGLCEACVQGA